MAMTNFAELLTERLKSTEQGLNDWKRQHYNLQDDRGIAKLVKAVIAMANTKRSEPAYIWFGVSEDKSSGERTVVGIKSHFDDNQIQGVLRSKHVKLNALPDAVYCEFDYKGLTVGVIQIKVSRNGPFYPQTDFEGLLKARQVYFRQGTANQEAAPETTREIHAWFDSLPLNSPRMKTQEPERHLSSNWPTFYDKCNGFKSDEIYVHITGPGDAPSSGIDRALSWLPISLVIDFDPNTEERGLYSQLQHEIPDYRSLHLWTLNNVEVGMSPLRACYWFAARGLAGRLDSQLPFGAGRLDWWARYRGDIGRLVDEVVRATADRPITVLVTWSDGIQFVYDVCAEFSMRARSKVRFVIANNNPTDLERVLVDAGINPSAVSSVTISLGDIALGVAQNLPDPRGTRANPASIPSRNGESFTIPADKLFWLEENMDVVHNSIELPDYSTDRVDVDNPQRSFLGGGTISWRELSTSEDAERDIVQDVVGKIEADLSDRVTTRINLFHWPGAGGTTVARRAAWSIRRKNPVVFVRQIVPMHVLDRLRYIFSVTEKPILAVVEAADSSAEYLEALYQSVSADNIPVVFVIVARKESGENSLRTAFVPRFLSNREIFLFSEKYKSKRPGRSAQIEELARERDISPFLFALTAFEQEFSGLQRFVTARLSEATTVQKRALGYFAIAHFYGHKPFLTQWLPVVVGESITKKIRPVDILTAPQRELLVEGESEIRPRHVAISKELIVQALSTDNDRETWRYSLAEVGQQLIRDLGSIDNPSEELLELLRRVFILRDEHSLAATSVQSFSQFIEHTPRDGKILVFEELTSTFPNEPHFHSHFGRFLSNVHRDHDRALQCHDKAVALDDADPVLHHMRGMCLRSKMYDYLEQLSDEERRSMHQDQHLIDLLAQVREAFAKARERDPDSEYSFISMAQLILRIIDSAYAMSDAKTRSEFLAMPRNRLHCDLLDEAEDLMAAARSLREGDRPSRYFTDVRASLQLNYDNLQAALLGWNNLLNRTDAPKPPVRRQIARAYLSKYRHRWSDLTPREVSRIIDLMSQNISEEPAKESNIRLWFRALRYSPESSMDLAIHRLATWYSRGNALDAVFYLYVLHAIRGIDGSLQDSYSAERYLEECSQKARYLRIRTRSFEWLGPGKGLSRLVHRTDLGEWDEKTDFFENPTKLSRVRGRVHSIRAPEAGIIEIEKSGLKAFFVPARAAVLRDADENAAVSFYLGFSYDGLRAWSVMKE